MPTLAAKCRRTLGSAKHHVLGAPQHHVLGIVAALGLGRKRHGALEKPGLTRASLSCKHSIVRVKREGKGQRVYER